MFITSAIANGELSIAKLIAIGHTHGLEEACLLMLDAHPHHSPPLAPHSNLTPNRLLFHHSKSTDSTLLYFA
jgi:hypothetical protein